MPTPDPTVAERLAVMEERQRSNSSILTELRADIHVLKRWQWITVGAFFTVEFLLKHAK